MIAGVVLLVIGGASSTPDVTPRRVPNKQSKKTSKPPETTDGGLTTMTTAVASVDVATENVENNHGCCNNCNGKFSYCYSPDGSVAKLNLCMIACEIECAVWC